jgi:hypothetical protein
MFQIQIVDILRHKMFTIQFVHRNTPSILVRLSMYELHMTNISILMPGKIMLSA